MRTHLATIFSTILVFYCINAHAIADEIHSNDGKTKYQYLSISDFIDKYNKISAYDKEMEKGEFETKEEYNKRVLSTKKEIQENFIIKITPTSYCFKYNADSERYTFEKLMVLNSSMFVAIETKKNIGREYTGKNAFGVTASIKETTETNHGVNFTEIKNANVKNYALTFSFKMKPAVAKELKGLLALAVEIAPTRVKGRFTSFNIYNHQPTISEPYDTTTKEYAINVRIIKIYVINSATNEILATIKM